MVAEDITERMRIEAMKILVRQIVEEAGDKGITFGDLKRRLGITDDTEAARLRAKGGA